MTFSSDSKLLADGTSKGTFLWDMESGEQLHPEPIGGSGFPGEYTPFSPDDRLLAAAYLGGPIGLWDVETSERVAKIEGHPNEQTISLAFAPAFVSDEEANFLLVSSGQGNAEQRPTVRFWESKTEDLLKTLNMSSTSMIRFTPNGKILILGLSDGTIQLWGIPSEME